MSSCKDKISVIILAGNGSPSGLEQRVPTILSEEVMLPCAKKRGQGLDSSFPAAMCSPTLVDSCPASLYSSVQQEQSSSSQSEDKMRSCLWKAWHIVRQSMLTLSLLYGGRPLEYYRGNHALPLIHWVKLHGKRLHVPHKNNRRTTFLALSIFKGHTGSNTIINLAGLQNAIPKLGIIISSSFYVYLFSLYFSLNLVISPSVFLFYPKLPHPFLQVLLPSSLPLPCPTTTPLGLSLLPVGEQTSVWRQVQELLHQPLNKYIAAHSQAHFVGGKKYIHVSIIMIIENNMYANKRAT